MDSSDGKRSKNPRKPLIERRRRARINQCLSHLRALISQTISDEKCTLSRLDKAEILELAVKHIHRMNSYSAEGPTHTDMFSTGFSRCMQEMSTYLQDKLNEENLSKLLEYLSGSLMRVDGSPTNSDDSSSPMTSPLRGEHVLGNDESSVIFENQVRDHNMYTLFQNQQLYGYYGNGIMSLNINEDSPILSDVHHPNEDLGNHTRHRLRNNADIKQQCMNENLILSPNHEPLNLSANPEFKMAIEEPDDEECPRSDVWRPW